MPNVTPNENFYLPLVNDPTDQDLWGGYLNANFTLLDSLIPSITKHFKRLVTGTDTASATDNNKIIIGDATAASYVQTLPLAASVGEGITISFVKADSTANTITLQPTGSDTIGTLASFAMVNINDGAVLISDGVSNWNFQAKATQIPAASLTVQGIIQLASQTEANAGTDALKGVTPSTLAGAITNAFASQSLTKPGYLKLPGGLIIQWGGIASGTSVITTFPIAFPSACLSVVATGTGNNQAVSTINGVTPTQFGWNPGSAAAPGNYIAIGH